ncbi:hypothetical protein [Streptomyces sp. YIM S03343]
MTHPTPQHRGEPPHDLLGELAKWLHDAGQGLFWYAEQVGRLSRQQQHDIRGLRQELAELKRDQDTRLNEMLARFSQLRQELAGAADVRHQDLSGRFRDLVNLHVLPFCVKVESLGPNSGESDVQLRRVMLTRRLCRLLFGALPAPNREVRHLLKAFTGAVPEDTQADLVERARSLCTTVNALRAEIADTGTPFRWDFEVASGTAYAPDRHLLWPAASPQAPVQYVVVPGYVVPGRPPHVQAMVFTALIEQPSAPALK